MRESEGGYPETLEAASRIPIWWWLVVAVLLAAAQAVLVAHGATAEHRITVRRDIGVAMLPAQEGPYAVADEYGKAIGRTEAKADWLFYPGVVVAGASRDTPGEQLKSTYTTIAHRIEIEVSDRQ